MGNLTTAHPCAVRVRETLQDHHVVSRVKTAFAYVLEVQSNRMLRDRESVALFMENIQDDVQDLESAVTGAQSELENHRHATSRFGARPMWTPPYGAWTPPYGASAGQ